jgi:hypothetical protein
MANAKASMSLTETWKTSEALEAPKSQQGFLGIQLIKLEKQ